MSIFIILHRHFPPLILYRYRLYFKAYFFIVYMYSNLINLYTPMFIPSISKYVAKSVNVSIEEVGKTTQYTYNDVKRGSVAVNP
jgi:hypothetical protein